MKNYGNKENIYSRIRKSSFYIILGKIVTPLVSFLITIYIVRKLSVDDYGIYNVLLGILLYIGIFSSLGLPSVFQRYIPEFHTKKEITKIKKLVLKGSLFRSVLVTVFLVLIIILSNLFGKLFNIENWLGYFELFSIGILFSLEASLIGLVLTSLFLHKYFVISNIVYVLMRAMLLYFLLNRGFQLKGLLLGEVVMYGILLLMFLSFYRKRFVQLYSQNDNSGANELPVKKLSKYGAFSYFNEMGVMILDVSTDFFIISIFLGPAAVGLYAFANRIAELLSRFLPNTLLQEVIRPSFFTQFIKKRDFRDLQKMNNLLTKTIALFSIPLTFGLCVLGDKVILYLFDPKYLPSLKVLWIVAAFLTIRAFQFPLGLTLQAIEKVNVIFYSKIFSVYNLVLDLLIVRIWGISGVALITGSAILFQNIFLYFFAYKYARVYWPIKPLFVIILNSTVMAFLLFLLRKFIVGATSLIIVALLGVIIYFVMSFLNKIFSQEERTVLNSVIGKPIVIF